MLFASHLLFKSMKTDTIFYQLFQTFPQAFFELIEQPSLASSSYQFTSTEIKQLAFRIDGLFLPLADELNEPIYFVEVQFQADKKFYQRLFGEIFLYLSKCDRANDWRAVVVFKQRSLDPGNIPQYIELLTSQRVRRIYLDELGVEAERSLGIGIVKLVVETKKKATNLARALFERANQEIIDEPQRKQVIGLIETILLYKLPELTPQELEAMFGLDELKKTRYFQEVTQEAMQKGLEEGRQEGRQAGKLEAVPKLLQMGLSLEQVAEALELSVEQVRQGAARSPN